MHSCKAPLRGWRLDLISLHPTPRPAHRLFLLLQLAFVKKGFWEDGAHARRGVGPVGWPGLKPEAALMSRLVNGGGGGGLCAEEGNSIVCPHLHPKWNEAQLCKGTGGFI